MNTVGGAVGLKSLTRVGIHAGPPYVARRKSGRHPFQVQSLWPGDQDGQLVLNKTINEGMDVPYSQMGRRASFLGWTCVTVLICSASSYQSLLAFSYCVMSMHDIYY